MSKEILRAFDEPRPTRLECALRALAEDGNFELFEWAGGIVFIEGSFSLEQLEALAAEWRRIKDGGE